MAHTSKPRVINLQSTKTGEGSLGNARWRIIIKISREDGDIFKLESTGPNDRTQRVVIKV